MLHIAEKQEETSSQRTLHAVVNGEDTAKENLFNNIVPNSAGNVNKKSYSFGEGDLDLGLYISEDSELSQNLKESGRAVGGLFEATRDTKLEYRGAVLCIKKFQK